MLKNYIKTALRSLWLQKSNTIINLSGLALGIASSLILFLLVRHMSSYDNYHTKRDRIYRVVTESEGNSGKGHTPGIPTVLPVAFRNDFPEAEEVTITSYNNGGLVTIPQGSEEPKQYQEDWGMANAQQNFFKIFDRKIISGDNIKALDEPNTAVISERLALKYFETKDVLGKTIRYRDLDYKITAVMEDFPKNTDFPFELMFSYITIQKAKEEGGWNSTSSDDQCYFLLKDGEPISKIESRMPEFGKKYLGEDAATRSFLLQSLKDIHYDDRFGNYNYNTVSRNMLSVLGVIAVFLILTACINFINLSTAEAIKRSKEVGIRKSLGSTRGQLIAQFMGESILVTVFAMVAALIIAKVALTFLNPFLDQSIGLNFSNDGGLWVFITVILAVVAGLSGLYPSFVVSGFNPILALKNSLGNRNSSGFNLRRVLVVVQFSISQFFIIGTIVLITQMNYFQSKELGFRRDAIINVPVPVREIPSNDGSSKMRTLRGEVARIAGVENVSLCNTPPSSGSVNTTSFTIKGDEKEYEAQIKMVDGNYLDLYDIKLSAGNNIMDIDTAHGYLVNEKLASIVGYSNPNDIVGKLMKMGRKELPIVGVIKDFHTTSLRSPIEATALFNRIRGYQNLSIKLNGADMQGSIQQIQKAWETSYPDHIFSYEFLDLKIKEFYENEKRISILLGLFTSLAIFIGCLGLFGLASFMANQKTKEIGVRKVLGASVESIVYMFSKEYIKLIIIGFIIASPFAWYIMNQWLDGFAYKIDMGPKIFISGVVITMVIAIATVGYRSLKAAIVNPADSLRSE
ncbi:MAG: FtsX-like permease family protein [Cyclobacteriaceae bacterium]|nr:FtsX-like permease family protein [Cyclobacteriaceae bacterium]